MKWMLVAAIGIVGVLGSGALAGETPAAGEEGERPAATPTVRACPSLTGDWSGTFRGGVSGEWYANFVQTDQVLDAAAILVFPQHGEVSATGSASITCMNEVVSITGSGDAMGYLGTFSGVADATGEKLSGTWTGGRMQGTWSGSK